MPAVPAVPANTDPAGTGPATVRGLLDAAVEAIGGSSRPGQELMADAVANAIDTGEHLLVQAGTGTGKSLAYLVPALRHSVAGDRPVVVATATLALQAQLVERDLPRLVDAVEPLLARRPAYAMLKGRRNYVCKNKLYGGMPDVEGDALFEAAPTTALGRDLLRVRDWAQETASGDRDELVPGVPERVWGQVSVSAGECLGAAKCPYGGDCFAENARAEAAAADVVVTNHALLAIDAIEGIPVLPEHDVVVVDEGHELVDRVTGAATAELTAAAVERAVARSRRLVSAEEADALAGAAAALATTLAEAPEGRLDSLPAQLGDAVRLVADAARTVLSATARERGTDDDAGSRKLASAAVSAVRDTAERIGAHSSYDVTWISREARRGDVLRVAPLAVAGLLARALFQRRTVVVTSATLQLGGSFDLVARSMGLAPAGDDGHPDPADRGWRGLDAGSPFDYPRQGILYVARHLPAPGRESMSPAALDELAELIEAAGGRTLGLFSSMRAARAATDGLRNRLDLPLLCQGEQSTAQLVRAFASCPSTCLFGTLSLWQGVDVPGPSLQLVVIDRIPFPRPDDPLASARARAVDAAGGSGFRSVSLAHAALRLAQGAGRLIRTGSDRGVVAVLDSRLATAGYGSFLRSSLPPFWSTTDAAQVRRSLAAISAGPPTSGSARAGGYNGSVPPKDKLAAYRGKRAPSRTPEPVPAADVGLPAGNDDTFVIQEHHARRLHWDFRLERGGVLVSWAVPKGLPPDPARNVLAVHTEDHPLDYAAFEGEIPRGQYGGGSVTIWDRGSYVAHKWRPDEVVVTLAGSRVRGKYALIHTDGDNWLVHRMDPPSDPQWAPLPELVRPMLAVPGALPGDRDDADFAYEMKWDGVRAVLYVEGGRVRALARSDRDVTASYPELRALGLALGSTQAVLDGEIVALDDGGRPSFARLQQRMHVANPAQARRLAQDVPVTFLGFDLLHLEGRSTLALPYDERRALLDSLDLAGPSWAVPPAFVGDGASALATSRDQGLEGVIVKRRDSAYEPGRRSAAWVKVKNLRTQEVVIGGWKPGEGRRAGGIGSLLLGVPSEKGLRYAGHVGTGFTERMLGELAALLRPLQRPTSPFADEVPRPHARDARWVAPTMVGEVAYGEWTRDGRLRHPSWRGLRPDKAPGELRGLE